MAIKMPAEIGPDIREMVCHELSGVAALRIRLSRRLNVGSK
jgi:hypothetical protein